MAQSTLEYMSTYGGTTGAAVSAGQEAAPQLQHTAPAADKKDFKKIYGDFFSKYGYWIIGLVVVLVILVIKGNQETPQS